MITGKRPKILIFGKNGQVGFELCRSLSYFGDLTALQSTECNIADPQMIINALDHFKPDIIVNAAAYTAVDKAEKERDLAFMVNAEAPRTMARWTNKHNALMIHYSTDYVFDGAKETPYNEEDKANPLNVYGKSKLAGDINIQNSGCDYFIFRTGWVYGARGKNFYLTIQKLLQEKDEIRVVDDQYGSPTWCRTIADITALILTKTFDLENRDKLKLFSGLYNLTSSAQTTWCGFAKAIREKMQDEDSINKLAEIIPISSSEYPLPARRPKHSYLSCKKLESTFMIKNPNWLKVFKFNEPTA